MRRSRIARVNRVSTVLIPLVVVPDVQTVQLGLFQMEVVVHVRTVQLESTPHKQVLIVVTFVQPENTHPRRHKRPYPRVRHVRLEHILTLAM